MDTKKTIDLYNCDKSKNCKLCFLLQDTDSVNLQSVQSSKQLHIPFSQLSDIFQVQIWLICQLFWIHFYIHLSVEYAETFHSEFTGQKINKRLMLLICVNIKCTV